MRSILKKAGDGMKRAGEAVGNVVSPVVLTIFYFALLPFFALPYQISLLLRREILATSFKPPIKQYRRLEDFEREY